MGDDERRPGLDVELEWPSNVDAGGEADPLVHPPGRRAAGRLAAPDALPSGGDAPGLARVEQMLLELRREVAELRAIVQGGVAAPSLVPVVEELAAVQRDLVALKRRVSLRVEASAIERIDDHIADIADAVVERLTASGAPKSRPRR